MLMTFSGSQQHDARAIEQRTDFKNLEQSLQDFIRCLTRLGNAATMAAISTEHSMTRDLIHSEQAETRDKVLAGLQALHIQSTDQTDCQKLLGSLHFPEIDTRQEEVSDAHRQTFEWIFDDSYQAIYPWDNFVGWLRESGGIYWINGKAGSGKSTLMNFICRDERTRTYLHQSRLEETIILTFFFWNAGSVLQKSSSGLLRSLLHQLLHRDTGLVLSVLTTYPDLRLKYTNAVWSARRLGDIFKHAVALVKQPLCVFLDGLDEFDEDEEYLIDLIMSLSMKPNIKVCVSSRPSNSFNATFIGYPQLRLQDLTERDMRKFVEDTLLKSQHIAYLSKQDKGGAFGLESEIVEKAQGVFLWVRIVVNILLRGLKNQDTWDELMKRLEILPSAIEKLYSHMWSRLNEDQHIYREQAAFWFRLILFGEWSLFTFTVAANPYLQASLTETKSPLLLDDILEKCKTTKLHLSARCAGLVEVHRVVREARDDSGFEADELLHDDIANEDGSEIDSSSTSQVTQSSAFKKLQSLHQSTTVRFIHRSARDFLVDTLDGKKILVVDKRANDDVYADILRARFAATALGLEILDFNWIKSHLEKIMDLHDRFQIELGNASSDLLDIFQQACRTIVNQRYELADPNEWFLFLRDKHDGWIPFARDFLAYVIEMLSPLSSSKWATNKLEIAMKGPIFQKNHLLFCAAHSWHQPKHLDLIMLLLENGADPNSRHAFPDARNKFSTELSAWMAFLGQYWRMLHISSWGMGLDQARRSGRPIEILQSFLEEGINLQDVVTSAIPFEQNWLPEHWWSYENIHRPHLGQGLVSFITMTPAYLIKEILKSEGVVRDERLLAISLEPSDLPDRKCVIRWEDGSWSRIETEDDINQVVSIFESYLGKIKVPRSELSKIRGKWDSIEPEEALAWLGWDRARPEHVRISFLEIVGKKRSAKEDYSQCSAQSVGSSTCSLDRKVSIFS